MSSKGGPVARLEHSFGDIFGEPCVHAVAYLNECIVDPNYESIHRSCQPDGIGCHSSAQTACHMAVSEALKRWAIKHCKKHIDSGLGGMAIDGSSCGFAAFPGLYRRQARKSAFCESIERHCLISWWEGLLDHKYIENPWTGISAISIDNPFSSHAVILVWAMTKHGRSYAIGAGNHLRSAARRALVKLARTQSQLEQWSSQLKTSPEVAPNVFERRIRYFSSEDGMEQFQTRLRNTKSRSVSKMNILFDEKVVGPWETYASVWRTIIEEPSKEYLSDREDYFFW